MRLLLFVLGLAALSLGLAHLAGAIALLSPGLAHAALGFGVACVLAGAVGGGALGEAPRRQITATMTAFSAPLCPTCSRPLLRGLKICAFCNPVFTPGGTVEQTREARPLPSHPLAVPGLAVAEKLRTEARACGYLHVVRGGSRGQSLLLTTSVVTIGRGVDNTFVLKDDSVSERHAELRPAKDGFLLRDLESTNGTFVNEQRITKQALRCGDVVRLGETLIFVKVD
jgi:hypothetical protein